MIKVLDKQVADKIAAGEVVDRPVSIVKELMENSIDAGATSITCEIKRGGKEYIRITDNGSGIEREEVETAFLRHATSKIRKAKDLEEIYTLGFRGEALASIVAVSKVTLITKTKESKIGTFIELAGSQVEDKRSIGCEDGTTITVEHLFYNTPARLKFLKADNKESSKIIDFVTQMALAYPHIAIRMISNGSVLFSTKGKGDRSRTIGTLVGEEIGQKLLTFEEERDGYKVLGYISGPGESKTNRRGQLFFVNGRVVQSKIIERAVQQAYSDRLFEGRFPIAYLFLEIDPFRIDVNVHPNKREIRFHEGEEVTNWLRQEIIHTLARREAIPEIQPKETIFKEEEIHPIIYAPLKQEERVVPTEKVEQVDVKEILSKIREEETAFSEEVEISKIHKPSIPFSKLHLMEAIFGTYILATDEENFYLIDQHAAHERIYFEQLREGFKQREGWIQNIMIPILLEVELTEENWMSPFKDMGFLVEPFGPYTYAISGIPMIFSLEEAESFAKAYVENIKEDTDFESKEVLDTLASRACKKAIKGNEHLDIEEIKQLMIDLEKCKNPFSCPHGRPTFIRMSRYEIEKRFKRV